MTLTADQIIKEAELKIQQDFEHILEKKASDTADSIIEERKKNGLDKVAEVVVETTDIRIKSFEKTAAAVPAAFNLKTFAAGLGKNFAANSGLRNAAIGAAGGAGVGALASKDGERLGGAIKGGLLGGTVGAAGSLINPTAIKSFTSNALKPVAPNAAKVNVADKVKEKVKDFGTKLKGAVVQPQTPGASRPYSDLFKKMFTGRAADVNVKLAPLPSVMI